MARRILPAISARELALALVLAAVGLLGLVPAEGRSPDPVALIAWLALVAPVLGYFAGASRMHAWVVAPVAPALWAIALAAADSASPKGLPTPVWSALAWSGLYAAGFGLGRAIRARARSPERARWSGACALLLASALVSWLATAGGALERPWPPALAARLLDLSPAALCAECAGLDWMRHPAVYRAAGTSDIDPSLRTAYRGFLAGPLVLVVGCAAALAGEWIARRRDRAAA